MVASLTVAHGLTHVLFTLLSEILMGSNAFYSLCNKLHYFTLYYQLLFCDFRFLMELTLLIIRVCLNAWQKLKPSDDMASTYIPEFLFKCITIAIVVGSMITGILIPNGEYFVDGCHSHKILVFYCHFNFLLFEAIIFRLRGKHLKFMITGTMFWFNRVSPSPSYYII